MEFKHSPAPWSIDELVQCSIHSGDKYIALINDANHFSSGEHKANAHLIAAAPELLEALQEIVENHCLSDKAQSMATKAIAKAIGQQ